MNKDVLARRLIAIRFAAVTAREVRTEVQTRPGLPDSPSPNGGNAAMRQNAGTEGRAGTVIKKAP